MKALLSLIGFIIFVAIMSNTKPHDAFGFEKKSKTCTGNTWECK
jgi:hypothetical protein